MMRCDSCKDSSCYRQGKDCQPLPCSGESLYNQEELSIMKVAASTEADYYMKATRLEEIIYFSKDMGFERLGVSFCIGLINEAQLLCQVLEKSFKVFSVCCKIGGLDKGVLSLKKMSKEGHESTCNPYLQAHILNQHKTELNLILGLCIGHDLLFTKKSEAYVTTFAVKDRVLCHNPLGALYSNYYRKKLQ